MGEEIEEDEERVFIDAIGERRDSFFDYLHRLFGETLGGDMSCFDAVYDFLEAFGVTRIQLC